MSEEVKEQEIVETKKERYKIYVHIKPIIMNMGNGQQAIVQEEDNRIYKRYGTSEEDVKEVLKTHLLQYYHNDWEIYNVELDKTHKAE